MGGVGFHINQGQSHTKRLQGGHILGGESGEDEGYSAIVEVRMSSIAAETSL